jgi:hypothetical protein
MSSIYAGKVGSKVVILVQNSRPTLKRSSKFLALVESKVSNVFEKFTGVQCRRRKALDPA